MNDDSMKPGSTCTIKPAKNIVGTIRLPGDKSISHRYAMLAALAEGKSRFENFSTGADCQSTLQSLRDLGCEISRSADGVVEVIGSGGKLSPSSNPLDCGNSGSTMRMLSGILAGQSFSSELVGDNSLSRRPMRRIVEPLTLMRANISAGEHGGPPLRISAPISGRLSGIEYKAPVLSAQVKSAVLFAGLQAEGGTHFEESLRTRDHGELALRAFGAEVQRSRNRVSIVGGQKLMALNAYVPGDISSAAFFMCAAALFPGSNLIIEAVGMNPTRAALLDVLTAIGARMTVINLEEHHGEIVGTLKVEHGTLRGTKISGAQSAQLIDELPVLAAIAPYTANGMEIRDARELRVKESDRIAAVTENLRRMGAQVEEHGDGWTISGGQRLHGAKIDSHGDHRIAMAFAIAALRTEGETEIHGAEAASISFGEFWTMLDRIAER
ncbi:MAG: 3-phosphoshikimate 1-carboxyvinyltransferase [Acidobacteriales bacterium]|nr:3-phosphoshikimate 1-carboxyvinyltransferase [Terriglobales bacterium]